MLLLYTLYNDSIISTILYFIAMNTRKYAYYSYLLIQYKKHYPSINYRNHNLYKGYMKLQDKSKKSNKNNLIIPRNNKLIYVIVRISVNIINYIF